MSHLDNPHHLACAVKERLTASIRCRVQFGVNHERAADIPWHQVGKPSIKSFNVHKSVTVFFFETFL